MKQICLIGALALAWGTPASSAAQEDPRMQRGEAALKELHQSAELPAHAAQLKREFPELAELTFEYALGDVWDRDVLKPRERQLIALSAFAAQGTLEQIKVHATYALDAGVPPQDLLEVVYIVTVTSGFPRALNAAGALKELFVARGIRLPVESSEPK